MDIMASNFSITESLELDFAPIGIPKYKKSITSVAQPSPEAQVSNSGTSPITIVLV